MTRGRVAESQGHNPNIYKYTHKENLVRTKHWQKILAQVRGWFAVTRPFMEQVATTLFVSVHAMIFPSHTSTVWPHHIYGITLGSQSRNVRNSIREKLQKRIVP